RPLGGRRGRPGWLSEGLQRHRHFCRKVVTFNMADPDYRQRGPGSKSIRATAILSAQSRVGCRIGRVSGKADGRLSDTITGKGLDAAADCQVAGEGERATPRHI